MKLRRKFISTIILSVFVLSGCSNASNEVTQNEETQNEVIDEVETTNNENVGIDTYSVVTTGYSAYDWTREIIGDTDVNVEYTMLLDNGVDTHSYQPTVEDIVKISEADMFIYVGGVSDYWVEEVLESSTNDDMIVINMFDVLSDELVYEELVDGMEETEHSHDHSDDETEEHTEEDYDHEHVETEHSHLEYDEHLWLSLNNAIKVCEEITDSLAILDSENEESYRANFDRYSSKLTDLDSEYKEVVENGTYDTLIFADRFPFRYLVDDYGLNYYAAFSGCSAETEASFETIIFLAQKVDELGLNYVINIDNSVNKIDETVINSTENKDEEILVLNSIQKVKTTDETTYLDVMESNLENIKTALE